MVRKKKSEWQLWKVVAVVLGVIGGIGFLLSFLFTGFFWVCKSYEPVQGTAEAIMQDLQVRMANIGEMDIRMEVTGFGRCQQEIIEKVKADLVGTVNERPVYFDGVRLKYYWCDASNNVMMSSSSIEDVQDYFDSLWSCLQEKTTSLFNLG